MSAVNKAAISSTKGKNVEDTAWGEALCHSLLIDV